MCDVNWIRLVQPYMAIDARSFVPPPLTESSVHANNQDVLSAIVHKIAYVVAEWCVAASMSPEVSDFVNRSEEHTSELQSQSNLVCRLLLEKKKDIQYGPAPQFELRQGY